jgi:hypothetical protein
MLGWIMDRMVERAIPRDVADAEQERMAQEAAESAIRQSVVIAGIAGLLVFVGFATLLYAFLPSREVIPETSQPSTVAPQVEIRDDMKLRQAKEEADNALDRVVRERDTLQQKITDLERRLMDSTRESSTAKTAAVAQDTAERARLQGKIGDLERQVADLSQKLQAAIASARTDSGTSLSRPRSRPAQTQRTLESPTIYRCGDGRSVRDPASCTGVAETPRPDEEDAVPSIPPTTYHCGDGRSVPDPADCRTAGEFSSEGRYRGRP